MSTREFNKFLQPVKNRLSNMIARGTIGTIGDGSKLQTGQVNLMADEVKDGVERFQQYGFTSVPLAGAEAVVVFPGGTRDHGLIIAVDDRRYRLAGLQGGEVALYTDEGDKIVLKRGGIIELTAATKVRMVTPRLECTGDIIDNCDSQARTVAGMREVYDLHTHDGVQPGAGNSGDPNQKMD
jgi:phage baseplate assembly protein V